MALVTVETPPQEIPLFLLPTPPETGVYETRQDLAAFLQSFAVSHGYAVSTKSSNKNAFVQFQCDRGGKYNNRHNLDDDTRKRKRETRRIGCPFKVSAKLTKVGWKLKVLNGSHNHEASPNMLDHPIARRPTAEDVERVMEMSAANISPKLIADVLSKPDKLLLAKDVSNILLLQKKKCLGLLGDTPPLLLLGPSSDPFEEIEDPRVLR